MRVKVGPSGRHISENELPPFLQENASEDSFVQWVEIARISVS